MVKRFLVSVPYSLHIWVEAAGDEPTQEEVNEAMMEEHGKYATIDIRHGGDEFDILEEEEV